MKAIIVVFLACMASGCGQSTLLSQLGRLAPECPPLSLTPNDVAGIPWASYQAEINVGDDREVIDLQLEMQTDEIPEKIVLVGFSPLGNRTFAVTKSEGRYDTEQNTLFRPLIPPETLLKLIELVLADLEQLRDASRKCALEFYDFPITTGNTSGVKRSIVMDERELFSATILASGITWSADVHDDPQSLSVVLRQQ